MLQALHCGRFRWFNVLMLEAVSSSHLEHSPDVEFSLSFPHRNLWGRATGRVTHWNLFRRLQDTLLEV